MPLKLRSWLGIFLVFSLMFASYSLGVFFAKGDLEREKMNHEELLEKISSKDRELSVKENELIAREHEIAALERRIAVRNELLQNIEQDIIIAKNELASIQREYNDVLQTLNESK